MTTSPSVAPAGATTAPSFGRRSRDRRRRWRRRRLRRASVSAGHPVTARALAHAFLQRVSADEEDTQAVPGDAPAPQRTPTPRVGIRT
jgi:hypothetical protein